MFSGRQSHRGKSQDPVAWVASAEETKRMKPTDKAIVRMVSESPGRNVSEPRKVKILERNETMGDVLHGPNGFGKTLPVKFGLCNVVLRPSWHAFPG